MDGQTGWRNGDGQDGQRDGTGGGMDRMDGRTLGLRRDGLTHGLDGWTDGLKWTEGWTSLTDSQRDRETEGWARRGWIDGLDKWMVKKTD